MERFQSIGNLLPAHRQAGGNAQRRGDLVGKAAGSVSSPGGARLLMRGLEVLSAIGRARQPMSFGQIATATGLPKATLSRILRALLEQNFVALGAAGRTYRLGNALHDLAAGDPVARAQHATLQDEIYRLADELEQPIWYWVVEGVGIRPVEEVLPFGMASQGRARQPCRLDGAAGGLAVLAAMESSILSAVLAQLKAGDPAPPPTLSLQLGFAVSTGFATARLQPEANPDAPGPDPESFEVAAAVTDTFGAPVAALSVVCAGDFTSEAERHYIGRRIAFACRRVSHGTAAGLRRRDVVRRAPKPDSRMAGKHALPVAIAGTGDQVGSSPCWDDASRQLFWIDSLGGAINRYRPECDGKATASVSARDRKAISRFSYPELPGAVALCQGARLLAASRDGIVLIDPQKGSKTVLCDPEAHDPLRRFSTARIGPDGRFWVGSLRPVPVAGLGQGRLYVLGRDGRITRVLDLERGAKGLCWSPDASHLYLTEAGSKSILRYEVNERTGRPQNPRRFITHDGDGTPNGIAMDSAGCLWAAIYGGWQVRRYDPKGRLMTAIDMPVPLPTGVCFGGARRQYLFITTCRLHVPPAVLVEAPASGALFRHAVDTPGVSERPFRLPRGGSI
ncbi:MAG: SMP-30/gluconolactonase/LRE family protein [Pseudomonadota bacterium]